MTKRQARNSVQLGKKPLEKTVIFQTVKKFLIWGWGEKGQGKKVNLERAA